MTIHLTLEELELPHRIAAFEGNVLRACWPVGGSCCSADRSDRHVVTAQVATCPFLADSLTRFVALLHFLKMHDIIKSARP